MSESLIKHSFGDSIVCQRPSDGYINLNQMAEATGKRIQDWIDNQSTKDLIFQFESDQNLHHANQRDVKPALVTSKARSDRGGGTWAHPDIAIQFAQWCSPAFALQVSRWVREWMTSGQNPLADIDRVTLRDGLKDESRTRMTDQIKSYLEQIGRYDDKKYSGKFFKEAHDNINKYICGETSRQMKERLSTILGKKVKDSDLIRDYFPSLYLQKYISLCEVAANLMLKDGLHPVDAVERASEIALPANYIPKPIDFVEHIKFVRERLVRELDYRRDELYKRLADK